MSPKKMSKSQQRRQQARSSTEVFKEAEAKKQTAVFNYQDPVKQYVRRFGWLDIIRDYLTRLQEAGITRTWKYLTFPGEFASDIGLLWKEGLIQTDKGILNVAICDKENAESVVASLSKLGNLLSYSNESLDTELSKPGSTLVEHFPFDVINLDFCNLLMFPSHATLEYQGNLSAIDYIFQLQKGQGFLLLLTSQALRNPDDLLLSILRDNLEQEERFREIYNKKYGGIDPNLCLQDRTTFTQIVFPKAIARWARFWGYRTHEHFVARYKRQGVWKEKYVQYDMICHSLEFEPLGVKQESSKYEPRQRLKEVPPNRINEKLHNNLSSRVQNQSIEAYLQFTENLLERDIQNIDLILTKNSKEREKLRAEAQFFDKYNWLKEEAR